MNVAIVIFDGFDGLDAIGPFEVFSHARTVGADIQVGLYTRSQQAIVTSSHGMEIRPDGTLDDTLGRRSSQTPESDGSSVPDIVVVPGGGWMSKADEGARAQVERGDLPDALADLHSRGATIASVCTGGMLLAAAGLTDGRPAVTHHGALEDLRESGAETIDARVVDDGDIVTSGGITAGIDLALHLLERAVGPDIADRVATLMEHEPVGEVYTG